MSSILISILAFIIAIGVLVTFHEFGHFWVARRLGVKVLRFSVGFGKPLIRWRDKQQTEYVIAAIPLGGYVKMLDEREGEVAQSELAYAFNRKSVWARFAIVLAGPVFNFLFAIVVYWGLFMFGIAGAIPIIGEIKQNSIAQHAGLLSGDEIVKVNHQVTNTWQQVIKQLMRRIGDNDKLEIEAKREGTVTTHFLDLSHWQLKGDKPDLLHGLGIIPYEAPIFPLVQDVVDGEAAMRAGILPGDIIVNVSGKSINSWKDFTDISLNSIDKPLQITVTRDGKLQHFTITPRAKETANGEISGYVGLVVKTEKLPDNMIRKEKLSLIPALMAAIQKTQEYITISFKIIGKMLVGDIGMQTLSGPITIAQSAGATLVVGLQYYLSFLALISISLGVLNLLPIPILDGGHLLFYLFEIILRKPLSERMQLVGTKIGFLFLVFLMLIAFYNDILRLK
ncbi:MAG: RIP metalloprotease RseP [Proteobacteria bacterium]|nr:RIP metalloprotease RseP [Pseudomonadota bacterium]